MPKIILYIFQMVELELHLWYIDDTCGTVRGTVHKNYTYYFRLHKLDFAILRLFI
jgi:hypothetical protein